MWFNFFSKAKQPPTTESSDIIASVIYSMRRGSEKPIISIEIEDYDIPSSHALCELLNILGQDMCYVETINMVKKALIRDHQEELLLKIFTNVGQQAQDKIIANNKESMKDEPCIKPSNLLK